MATAARTTEEITAALDQALGSNGAWDVTDVGFISETGGIITLIGADGDEWTISFEVDGVEKVETT